jgi:hypothetical protein
MTKRPSLAESLKAVERPPSLAIVPPPAPEPLTTATETEAKKVFHAATREGLKKVTTGVDPATHKLLKHLAADAEKSVETLLREAIDDLIEKYKRT